MDIFEFEFLIQKTISMINKRVVAFKKELRSLPTEEVPEPISPEMLIKGYETMGLNVVPGLQSVDEEDDSNYFTDTSDVRSRFEKLNKVKARLIRLYHSEFLSNLIDQALDKVERNKPVPHDKIKKGDIVLLIENNTKRYLYPLGRVESTEENELGEVTAAVILKGCSRERV